MFSKYIKKSSKKVGLPPGSLVHIGEKKVDKVGLSVIDYDPDYLNARELKSVEEAFPFKDSPTVTWLNIIGLHEIKTLEKIGNHFGIHPLVMEDILNTSHQPKSEIYDDYVFAIIKMIRYNPEEKKLEFEQVSIILGESFVITFQEREGDIFEPVRQRIQNPKSRLRRNGPDYLTYALLDVLVDNYYIIMENLEEVIESLEELVLQRQDESLMKDIQKTKRATILLRKSVWPLRDAIDEIMSEDSNLIKEFTAPYLRDLYDHAIHVIETIEMFREMVSGIMDLYLSNISNRMNEVMKILTIIASVFIPLTFIAGIYGMNFENMPELKWPFGYHLVLAIMLLIVVISVILFKKRKWI